MSADEHELRARLGVPKHVSEVVVVAESSHWDPNWLLTSDRYYRICVRPTLDRALRELAAEPRRVFSLECMFFVDRYWHDRPEHRTQLRSLVNEGRLRFTGCGVTTPDTLLPDDELLLRDLLAGQEWLRARGMLQEPRLLYLPDSFGHSPGLPSLLQAAGIEYAAICRIDGMRFPGADLEPAANFPRPGTSAARLTLEGTADFVWRSSDGSEVLTHWMSHGYGHGDMIASGGISRIMGLPLSWQDRRPGHVDARIDRYLADLRPLARTPYRLLAIGFDFVRPVPRLVDVLDGWNERHHERTGTWLVNAAVDDYLDLVSGHQASLPTLELDPNPYWMGFYATRPDIKAASRELGRRLIANDVERAAMSLAGSEPDDRDEASRSAWWTAVTSNHHDFVTGTAPDRVARGEQATWLAAALEATPWPNPPPGTLADSNNEEARPATLSVRRVGRLVVVAAGWGTATFDPRDGGALVSLTDSTGSELIDGPSLELHSYSESGGLWRMGQEFYGGRWALTGRSSRCAASVDVEVDRLGATARVSVRPILAGHTAVLHHTIRASDPTIVTHSSVVAPCRRTVTLVVRQARPTTSLTMHQPGGLVDRPLERWYDPTYWPLHSFAVTRSEQGPDTPGHRGHLGVATATPTGVHVHPDGTIEVIVARTAVKEIAFRVVPVMAPAWGRSFGDQAAVIAMGWDRPGGPEAVSDLGRHLRLAADRGAGHRPAHHRIQLDGSDVEVIATKPAERGAGTIIRLRNWSRSMIPQRIVLTLSPDVEADIVGGHLTDSRERDLEALQVIATGVEVPINSHLTTVRLLTRPR